MSKKIQIIVLPIICLLLGMALAGVYNMTAPIIAEVEKNTANEARREVLAAADDFTEVTKEFSEDLGIKECYKATNGEGATFMISTSGYGGEISMMVGISSEGKITGTKILSHSETPGLGAKANNPDFLSQYNKKGGSFNVVKNSPKDENDIVAVSSATTTSKAVTKGINNVLTAFEQIKGEL